MSRIYTLFVLALVVLLGCMSPGYDGPLPAPAPLGVSQVTEGTFDATLHPLYIGAFPWTYTMRYKGSGRVVLQYPAKPHVWLDGEFTWEIVVPTQAAAVAAEMRAGNFKVGR